MGRPGAAFTAVIQLGTEAAVLIYFRKETLGDHRHPRGPCLCGRPRAARTLLSARMGWYVIVGTLPIAILGLTFKDRSRPSSADLAPDRTTRDRLRRHPVDRPRPHRPHKLTLDKHLSFTNALLSSALAQSLALIPGRLPLRRHDLPRGCCSTYPPRGGAKYSSCCHPRGARVGCAGAVRDRRPRHPDMGPTITGHGHLVRGGYAACGWFLKYISTHRFTGFVIYRIPAGVFVIAAGVVGLDPSVTLLVQAEDHREQGPGGHVGHRAPPHICRPMRSTRTRPTTARSRPTAPPPTTSCTTTSNATRAIGPEHAGSSRSAAGAGSGRAPITPRTTASSAGSHCRRTGRGSSRGSVTLSFWQGQRSHGDIRLGLRVTAG
ncbi:undecaprenyl-diphosphate phosphatase [Nonomuraea dietziae]|uniref:undecaprenyl-diphosphate phosphatase n=1 Tax=Nonomuraea dietziae TaxID=65515 RepID=UPI003CD09E64